MNSRLKMAVVGAGAFGQNHVRVLSQTPEVELVGVVDLDFERAERVAAEHGIQALRALEQLPKEVTAAVVATPTVSHEEIAGRLLASGVDVLVEKPIAQTAAAGERLTRLAKAHGRVLQVGHLERFNPAVIALERALTVPLFFEVHRLSVFTPRSLDVDVVLDLMIHDLDIVLSFTGRLPEEIRAAGISVLSPRVDIANVRLAFASGCVANLTASRVSTEKVRKLRLFQPGEYISVDYQRQDATRLRILPSELQSLQAADAKGQDGENDVGRDSRVGFVFSSSPKNGFVPQIGFDPLKVEPGEPLQLELASFLDAVRGRSLPRVDGVQATNALRVAEQILVSIEEHAQVVSRTLREPRKS